MTEYTVKPSAEVFVDLNEKKPIRVLHVDDETSLLKIAKQCLEMEGSFQVDTVSSADQALERIKAESYDAIVSDYQMPEKDGLEFLKELRDSGNNIPFIIFTGKGREEVAIKAWSLGADHYVNKSGDPETVYYELAHCLRSAVERRKAEIKVTETIHKLQTIYQNAVEGISYVDSEENFSYVNKAFADILGCREDMLIGMNLRGFVDEESWRKIKNEAEQRKRGRSSRYEVTFCRNDGTRRNVMISGSPVFDYNGVFAGTVGIVLDITERKKAEKELREREEKFRTLFEMANDGLVFVDFSGKIVDINQKATKMARKRKEDIVGKSFLDLGLVSPKDLPILVEKLAQRATVTPEERFEFEIRNENEQNKFVEISTTIIREKDVPRGLLAIVRDVTERKKAEEELQRFSAAVKASIDGVVMSDLEGKIVELNDAALRFYGGESKSDLIGKSSIAVVPEEKEKLIENMQEVMTKGYAKIKEIKVITKTGESIFVEITTTLVRDTTSRPVGFLGIIRDVTERRRTEEALRLSEEKYKGLFENAKDVIVLLDLKGNVTSINKAASEYGFNRSEMLGKNMLKFVSKRYWPKLLKDVAQLSS